MNASIKSQIEEYEEQLRLAMLQSNTAILEDLLSPDLLFTNHLGHLISKQDDIAAHRSGMLKINHITLTDPKLKILDSTAIVSVKTHIVGSFNGELSDNHFRFTRVWGQGPKGDWQVIAGHSGVIV